MAILSHFFTFKYTYLSKQEVGLKSFKNYCFPVKSSQKSFRLNLNRSRLKFCNLFLK